MLATIAPPPPCRLARALRIAGALLDRDQCAWRHGGCHFQFGERSIAIFPESAGRFRLELWELGRLRARVWSLDGEDVHLAGVVLALRSEVQGDRDSEERLLR